MAPTMMEVPQEPSLRNLTRNFSKPRKKQNKFLKTMGAPHVESFNNFLKEGLIEIVKNSIVEFALPNSERVCLTLESVRLNPPALTHGTEGVKSLIIWPTECRQRGATYRGHLYLQLSYSINGVQQGSLEKDMGEIPIMVKSDACHLSTLSPAELISKGEHGDEWGGYFVIKGHEKLIRMLLMTRRNYPVAVQRSGWKKRGDMFSDMGVLIRCVTEDHTSTNNVLHFVNDGTASLMFSSRRTLYFAPIVMLMKCLLDVPDVYIYQQLMAGFENNHYYQGCVTSMLRTLHEKNIHSQAEAKAYLGKSFRVKFYDLPSWTTDAEICDYIIKNCLAIHLSSNLDKFNLYVLMVQKLFALAEGKCCVEGVDSIMVQEMLLGGHLYQQVVKEKLQTFLSILRTLILKKADNSVNFKLSPAEMAAALKRCQTLETSMENFLATGNLSSPSGLGLMQDKGLVIVAENINRMRYMSHFRAVHRGAYFQQMRTTEARQLLPDAWGFICPVHTPDGAPCGLLNHLTKSCVLTTAPDPRLLANVPPVLASLGMTPLGAIDPPAAPLSQCLVTVLDGRVLGHVPSSGAGKLVQQLRVLKLHGDEVPKTMEIVLVPKDMKCGQFSGLFLFTNAARMMRPVYNIAAKGVELIGTFEQVYLDICVRSDEAYTGITTHQEISTTNFLSNLACLIPMPDCNQSPRNMYQCQMGKQTMGTPCHTFHLQSATKLYRLQTPATPLFRPVQHDLIGLDDFAMGTNAIVAVISYTGYDMEDAMVINKSSFERGFGHGSVLKSTFYELKSTESYFGLDPQVPNLSLTLDEDGLPRPGAVLKLGDPICCMYSYEESKFIVEKVKTKESVYVDNVRLCGGTPRKACVTIRIARNPSVGDKFASRAGQKGICSRLWPCEDLPFTQSGLVPDIVFNPHGFPSRMTIAMMIELMAGKSAALHGLVHDATPFRFSEEDTAIDYFGRMLEAGGYNYYGKEKMYCGTDGRELNVQIFFGVVHYQRLRHMVSDKWQVRSTGPIDILTQQPVKGRRRGGGVRFGEMERDSLLSHGASFLLQDRLFHCSDKTVVLVCKKCGSIISCYTLPSSSTSEGVNWCQMCEEDGDVAEMEIPYIFRYLVAQLAAVNIKIVLQFQNPGS